MGEEFGKRGAFFFLVVFVWACVLMIHLDGCLML